MAYATQQDLIDRYGERELIQVTDKFSPPSGAINEDTLNRALADADAEIDSRIGVRYTVPLSSTIPQIIVNIACRLARYKLHEDRASEKIRKDFEDALEWLDKVAIGKANVPGLSEPVSSNQDVSRSGFYAVAAPPVVFTNDVLALMP